MLDENRHRTNVAGHRPNFYVLWVVVTSFWIGATIFAIDTRWPLIHGGADPYQDRFVWLCLLLPPLFLPRLSVDVRGF